MMFYTAFFFFFCVSCLWSLEEEIDDYDGYDKLHEKRSTSASRSSCSSTKEFRQITDAYDSYQNQIKLSQTPAQWFHVVTCSNSSGPPTCLTCCYGIDSSRYTSWCAPIRTLQGAYICTNVNCSTKRPGWIYVNTGCSCYYRPKPL